MNGVETITIDAGHFYAAVVVDDSNVVVKAAPIVCYMIGWTSKRVYQYCRDRKWKTGEILIVREKK